MQKYISLQQNIAATLGSQKPFDCSWPNAVRRHENYMLTEEGTDINNSGRLYLCSCFRSGGTLKRAA